MFGKRQHNGTLALAAAVTSDERAIEVLRAWVKSDGTNVALLKPGAFADSAAWGILLADVARHVANAISSSSKGGNPSETLARIRELFDAELNHPTDTPTGKWEA